MTPLTISFQEALWQLADRVGVNLDPNVTSSQGTGVVGSNLDIRRMAGAIREAYKWAYEAPRMPWPETVNGVSNITVTNGGIAWSTVDFGRWWDLWSTDPRPVPQPANCYAVGSRFDGDGIWLSQNALALGSVFAFRQARTPQFTGRPWVLANTYNAEDVVWDAGTTVTGDPGECYRALQNVPASTALTNTAYWIVQPFFKCLEDAVLMAAEGRWLKISGDRDAAAKCQEEAQALLEREFVRSFAKGQEAAQAWGAGTWGIWR